MKFFRTRKGNGKLEKMKKNQQPSERFTILIQDEQFKWVLPDLVVYANLHFNQYVQERIWRSQFWLRTLFPLTLQKLKKLDEFTSDLLKENNKTSYKP